MWVGASLGCKACLGVYHCSCPMWVSGLLSHQRYTLRKDRQDAGNPHRTAASIETPTPALHPPS